MSKMAPD